jgi:DNA-binding Lrp family transcriptional regulator
MPPRNYTYPSILEALEERGDMTHRELVEDLKCSPVTVHDNLRKLMKDGKIHICDWLPPKGKGARSPVYRLGYGRNANWAVQSQEDRNAKKLGWAKNRAMRKRIAAHAGNPFSSLIAQVSA